jgi:hypothetical protein
VNAPHHIGSADVAAAQARDRRQRRAATAQRLLSGAPDAVAALDWDSLDSGPAWLALPEAALATFQRRVGAVLCAPTLRLWIDGPRLGAARVALGESFLQALLARRDWPALPRDVVAQPRIDVAEQVGVLLQVAGAAVLLASLSQGPLRRVVSAAMTPRVASAAMAPDVAQTVVALTQTLVAKVAPAGARATPVGVRVESAA